MQKCGEAINKDSQEADKYNQKFRRSQTKREIVYEGNIHKCPNCGEVMEAFLTICPSCGHEFRDVSAPSSVRELAEKLESISAQKMPDYEEKNSIMKMVFGKDFKAEDEAEKALERFESQKNEEKASLISNYPVPNSKEDIMEFMILASSNIDPKKDLDDVVIKAWISKLDQVYQRAELSMGNQPDFLQIKSIYDRKKNEIKKKKQRGYIIGIGCVVGYIFLMGLLLDPKKTIIITIIILILAIIGIFLFKKR